MQHTPSPQEIEAEARQTESKLVGAIQMLKEIRRKQQTLGEQEIHVCEHIKRCVDDLGHFLQCDGEPVQFILGTDRVTVSMPGAYPQVEIEQVQVLNRRSDALGAVQHAYKVLQRYRQGTGYPDLAQLADDLQAVIEKGGC